MIVSPTKMTAKIISCDNNGSTTVSIPSTTSIDGSTYSVIAINSNVFQNCTGLVSVNVPSSVTSIASNAFYGCNSLTSINVESSDTIYSSVNGVLFDINKKTLIEYPAGKSGAYSIPSTVTSIGDYAFMSCKSLTSVDIPTSVISIGNYTFYGCSGLTSATIPSSVTSLGNFAFSICSGLASVTIPSSVISIGNNAFSACSSLSSLHVGNSNPSNITLGSNVFYSVPATCKLYVPTASTSLYAVADQWKAFATIVGE